MPKKTKSSAKRGAAATVKSNAKTNKSAFVRSLAATLSASDVIARGKTRGIRLSAAQVYTIRANARRKGPKDARPARPIAASAAKRGGRKSGRGGDSREAEFIAAALDLGLAKAEGLISALRRKAVAAMS